MKIIHVADTHLGFSAYNRVDSKGRNLREEIIYKNFKVLIERIKKERPDAVVHAGDVFHHVRPRIKPLLVFKRGLDELQDKGIPVIIISGNHDSPKSQATTSPFTLFEGMKDVFIAHKYRYEMFDVGDSHFHCIPFCQNVEDYKKKFDEICRSENDVLVMHGLMESIRDKRLNTVGEHELSESFLRKDFSYIALGHYHGQAQITSNAWYSGSIEYFKFGDIYDKKKGMLSVDLNQDPINPKPICLDEITRMKQYSIQCDRLSAEEIIDELQSKCDNGDIKDNIVRVRLDNILKSTFRNLNSTKINKFRSEALYFELFPKYLGESVVKTGETIDHNMLPDEFEKFISDEIQRERVPKTIQVDVTNYGKDLIRKITQLHNTEGLDASS
ncbi:MAG: DNA repair exonuclease [Methanothrix sp.]|nr:DNA repair exonuclease [Methanothrix sp.]MDD4446542.1 DNA repair exonuclease [Methanothrix sp.]